MIQKPLLSSDKAERWMQFKTDFILMYLVSRIVDVYNHAEVLEFKEVAPGEFTPIYSETTNKTVEFWENERSKYIKENFPEFLCGN